MTQYAIKLALGGLAGWAAWFLMYPFDVVKTVMQQNPNDQRRMKQIFKDIYREEGILGFSRGMRATATRVFPMEAICLVCYDEFRKLFKGNGQE